MVTVPTSKSLLAKVEEFLNLLIHVSTGGMGDDEHYRQLRSELMAIPRLKEKLPDLMRTCRDMKSFWSFIKGQYGRYEQRRQYLRREFEPTLSMLETETNYPTEASISAAIAKLDSEHVEDAWRKALERRKSDPEGAITMARTLIESVCKHILDENGVVYDERDDLPKLYSLTSKQLNLSPSQHTEKIFRQILGGCHSVVEGLGALRNTLSDAHGRGKKAAKPSARHAELAVNLAGSMATFLVSTWQARPREDS